MLRLIDVDHALELVLERCHPLPLRELPISESQGCFLADDLRADRDAPPFDRALKDGYAVRVADAGGTPAIRGEVAAGGLSDVEVGEGTCVAIMTGGACPPGTEAVVMKEEVQVHDGRARLPEGIAAGQELARRGSEVRAGTIIAPAGSEITPLVLANLAAFGVERVRVVPRPSVAIVTTGDELARPGERPGPTQIRDSNGPMLAALAQRAGCSAVVSLHAQDDLQSLTDTLEQATARAEIIVLSGGVSMGRYDLVPAALERIGAAAVFHKIRQKPGKPLLFAAGRGRLFFGLPGTPLGSHLGFHRYVRPALRRMAGAVRVEAPGGTGTLSAPLTDRGGRTKFRLVRVRARDEGWQVDPLPSKSSSDFHGPALANAYVRLPEGEVILEAGDRVGFEWAGGGR